eukprot:810769-Pyramimonas_sp.AAC.1
MLNEKDVSDKIPQVDAIDWKVDTSDTIIRKVKAAASSGPGRGIRAELMGVSCILRGAHPEDLLSLEPLPCWPPLSLGEPKTVGYHKTLSPSLSPPGLGRPT